ncbi:MAG: pantoate--beta-alanine ligase [Thermoleophilia bacterium]
MSRNNTDAVVSTAGGAAIPMVARTIDEARESLAALRGGGGTVGLVPTMGCLHGGHLSLMRKAAEQCDIVALSIFVNAIQFAPGEDLDAYPSDIDSDLELAAGAGAGLVFAPSPAEMYPRGFETLIDVGSVTAGLCGQSRPGHFQGVATVVAKLFNIIRPERAYFGQKDAQQVAVIRRLARDLDYGIEIVACPTVREADGLALSSRNSYLSDEERAQANSLYEALTLARDAIDAGETSVSRVKRMMRKRIGENFQVEYEYARVVDPETIEPVDAIAGPVLLAVAARVGRARLIDNMLAKPPGGR